MYFFYSKIPKNISRFNCRIVRLCSCFVFLFSSNLAFSGVHFGLNAGAKSSVLEIPKNFSDLKNQTPRPSFYGGAYFSIDWGKYFYTDLGLDVSNIKVQFEQEEYVDQPAKFQASYTNIQAPISLGVRLFPLKIINWNFFGGVTFNFGEEQKETLGSIGNIKVPTSLNPSYLSCHVGSSLKIGPLILGANIEKAITSYASIADNKIGNKTLNFFIKIQLF